MSREFEILDMMRGKENVIQMIDFFYTYDKDHRLIQNTVLEFCDMSIEDVIRDLIYKLEWLPMATIKKFVRQIFNGL